MLCGEENFRLPSIFAARLGAMQAARPQDRHGRACGDVDAEADHNAYDHMGSPVGECR